MLVLSSARCSEEGFYHHVVSASVWASLGFLAPTCKCSQQCSSWCHSDRSSRGKKELFVLTRLVMPEVLKYGMLGTLFLNLMTLFSKLQHYTDPFLLGSLLKCSSDRTNTPSSMQKVFYQGNSPFFYYIFTIFTFLASINFPYKSSVSKLVPSHILFNGILENFFPTLNINSF